MRRTFAAAVLCTAPLSLHAAPVTVLFVGNSFTFANNNPAMHYNAGVVRDMTAPVPGTSFEDTSGSRPYQPHPWGGVPGIFKKLTDQAGLDYEVSLSTRNAASLRGHFLNTNPANWDLRGNIASQTWDKVVLQEQSDEPLMRRTNTDGAVLEGNPAFFRFYADTIRRFVQSKASTGIFYDSDAFPGATFDDRVAACRAAGVSRTNCTRERGPVDNPNADPDTKVFLYQTWARPDLIDGAFDIDINRDTGDVTRLASLSTGTFFPDLEAMTAELVASYAAAAGPGFAGIAPVGEAFLHAVESGIATRDMWAPDALSDGLIDLWHDDGLHASKYGSYLSALVLFGTLTGLDPALFGASEIAAMEMGIDGRSALLLQRTASRQLGLAPVPLPATAPLVIAALALLGAAARRKVYNPKVQNGKQ